MSLLLDTHVFLWFISRNARLPADWRDIIGDAANIVGVSVASIWECILKHQLGKLPLPAAPEVYLPDLSRRHNFSSVPIEEADVVQLASLPLLHRDPFDRILVAQAKARGMWLMTVDPLVQAYFSAAAS